MGQQAKPALPELKQFASLESNSTNPHPLLDKNFDYDLRAAKALVIKMESAEKK
jgi:hypothetical protein